MQVEIMTTDFVFEGDLKTMTEDQKAALRQRQSLLRSVAASLGFDDAMTNPTRVYAPGSPEYEKELLRTTKKREALVASRKRQGASTISDGVVFDPQQGYVVEGEDINVLVNSGMGMEEAIRTCSTARPKVIDRSKIKMLEIHALGPVQRDAEIRFGRL